MSSTTSATSKGTTSATSKGDKGDVAQGKGSNDGNACTVAKRDLGEIAERKGADSNDAVDEDAGKKVKYSFGYPKNDFTRPGYDDKVRLCEVIDFKTKEGKQEFHRQSKLIEEKHVELMKEDFLQNTELYINTMKDKRSALERAHMDRVLLIQKEKRK